MAESRTRPFVSMSIHETGNADLGLSKTYAKVQAYTPPPLERRYTAVGDDGFAEDAIPSGWDGWDFSIVLLDYSLEPEDLLDNGTHTFIAADEVGPGGLAGGTPILPQRRRARYEAYVTSVNRGTRQRGQMVPVTLNLRAVDVWYKKLGTTEAFSGSSPVSSDLLRVSPHYHIHWVNGVDVEAARKTLLTA